MGRTFHIPDLGPRLSPGLAAEIGLRESLLLLQIEFWLQKHGERRDGYRWTRRTINHFQKQFPFIPKTTIRRKLLTLEAMGLIRIASKYNRWPKDRTRWYSLHEENCNKLDSIQVLTVRKSKDLTLSQNELTLSHSGSAIRDNLKKEDNTESACPPEYAEAAYVEIESLVDCWVDNGLDEIARQPFLSPSFKPKEKGHKIISETIPKPVHFLMYRICFRAETDTEALTLTSAQRGRVASVLGQLRDAGADFHSLHIFEAWWTQNWRSRDRVSGHYQPPRPEQVLEFWNEAIKSGVRPKPVIEQEEHKHELTQLTEIMKQRRAS